MVRTLRPFVEGQSLQDIKVYWPRIVQGPLKRTWQGQTVKVLKRRAKFIVMQLDSGFLTTHLRMTGQLIPVDALPRRQMPHVHAAFVLTNGAILFQDVRKFGRIRFLGPADYALWESKLGCEPLEESFTADWLYESTRKRRRQLKPALLDQGFIAGLGNIYVDEALFVARLQPTRLAADLSRQDCSRLHGAIQKVLRKATAANGSSFMDFKFLGGQEGGYTDEMLVFRRTGLPCPRCKRPIERIVLGGRSTHFCRSCQI